MWVSARKDDRPQNIPPKPTLAKANTFRSIYIPFSGSFTLGPSLKQKRGGGLVEGRWRKEVGGYGWMKRSGRAWSEVANPVR